MTGLCEGGNESPGSLKDICKQSPPSTRERSPTGGARKAACLRCRLRESSIPRNGSQILQVSNRPLSYHSAKRLIHKSISNISESQLSTRASDKEWKETIRKFPESPRSVGVVEFRLTIGHDRLPHHLYRIDIKSSPLCTFCDPNEVMDETTNVLSCSKQRQC
ncbi:hypothetical protein ANN_16102 [Periplaneta americana]|uniref:Uncharacterized protein n=1 Tax=Periplaneta americana TaxID=6978 RepID=A0ABQ8SJ36_PERAM|nr:hypothetical protein ANN_16102 [Periplaneta americana]